VRMFIVNLFQYREVYACEPSIEIDEAIFLCVCAAWSSDKPSLSFVSLEYGKRG